MTTGVLFIVVVVLVTSVVICFKIGYESEFTFRLHNRKNTKYNLLGVTTTLPTMEDLFTQVNINDILQ